jgi:GT2 family glycosyltransferase
MARRAAFARGRGRPPLPLEPLERGGLWPPPTGERPPVAVVAPFAGDREEGAELLAALGRLRRRDGDEVVVVDNSRTPALDPGAAPGGVRVVPAAERPGSYFARNAGARATSAEWILFTDADCRPAPWLLDAFFAPAPSAGAGAVAGAVLPLAGAAGVVERFGETAGVLSQAASMEHPYRPYAVTANLLVRRSAWEAVGGFTESVRSSGDADFCWRLQEAGMALEYRPRAAVLHAHRTSLRGLLRQYRRYGSGVAWLERTHPGSGAGWAPSASLLRAAAIDLTAGRYELALNRLLVMACDVAAARGRRDPNTP